MQKPHCKINEVALLDSIVNKYDSGYISPDKLKKQYNSVWIDNVLSLITSRKADSKLFDYIHGSINSKEFREKFEMHKLIPRNLLYQSFFDVLEKAMRVNGKIMAEEIKIQVKRILDKAFRLTNEPSSLTKMESEYIKEHQTKFQNQIPFRNNMMFQQLIDHVDKTLEDCKQYNKTIPKKHITLASNNATRNL